MVNQRPGKNFKELSIENKSMPIGWGQENVINSEIDHAWAVEWMRLAGCSLYTYTVCTYSIRGRFFYCGSFFCVYCTYNLLALSLSRKRKQRSKKRAVYTTQPGQVMTMVGVS
jgi:hypothetical protein